MFNTSFPKDGHQIGRYKLVRRTGSPFAYISWTDPLTGKKQTKTTKILAPAGVDFPIEAKAALTKEIRQAAGLERPITPSDAYISDLLGSWSTKRVGKTDSNPTYQYGIVAWIKFFEWEYKIGWLPADPKLSDITREVTRRFRDFCLEPPAGSGMRKAAPATVKSRLDTLHIALNWCADEELIDHVPLFAKVPADQFRPTNKFAYSIKQLAAFLDAASRRDDRSHLMLFAMIMLGTHGRVEAVLELLSDQIDNGFITFNAYDRIQTRKYRASVPIVPTLAPWLTGIKGKVVCFKVQIRPERWQNPAVPEFNLRATFDIENSFEQVALEAGLMDPFGKTRRLRSRVDSSIKTDQSAIVMGTPNILRHTAYTHLLELGLSEPLLKYMAGHTPVEGSGIDYLHLGANHVEQIVLVVERLFSKLDEFTDAHRKPPTR